MLSLSHHAIVVAESSGEVVGVAGACVDHGVELDAYGRITALAVDAKWRGRGVGKLLVQHVERWCRERGADRVTLTSGHHRPESHNSQGDRLRGDRTSILQTAVTQGPD